jgi:hypothetical protein
VPGESGRDWDCVGGGCHFQAASFLQYSASLTGCRVLSICHLVIMSHKRHDDGDIIHPIYRRRTHPALCEPLTTPTPSDDIYIRGRTAAPRQPINRSASCQAAQCAVLSNMHQTCSAADALTFMANAASCESEYSE